MGLNLNIGRVVFSTLRKYDGISERALKPQEVKQIGGRAGRYGSIYPSGEITCIEKKTNDWLCGNCGAVCFQKRTRCFRCNEPKSERSDLVKDVRPQGDGDDIGT
jgi:hypothetical protein